MIVSWKDENENKITALYWSDGLTLKDLKKYGDDCDFIQVWYPQNLSDEIYDKYGEIFTFIETEASWKGKATSSRIDLTLSNEDIVYQFSRTRRYGIRRAKERDNLIIEVLSNLSEKELMEYETFYNSFAQQTGELGKLDINKVKALNKTGQFTVTKVLDINHEILTMHGYLLDKEKKIAALFSSSSLFRENKEKSALISRANALLHYESMIYFKNNGYKMYDFGGIYLGDKNQHFISITTFKRSFGGDIVEFQNGFMIPINEAKKIDKSLIHYMHEIDKKDIVIWGYSSFGKYVKRQLELNFSKTVMYIIDNKLCGQQNIYVSESILNELDENKVLILVTTSVENYNKIISHDNCTRFVRNEKIVCLRKE